MKVKRVIKVYFCNREHVFLSYRWSFKRAVVFFNGLTSTLKFPVKTANTAWNQVSIRCSNAFAANILQPATLAPPLCLWLLFLKQAQQKPTMSAPLFPQLGRMVRWFLLCRVQAGALSSGDTGLTGAFWNQSFGWRWRTSCLLLATALAWGGRLLAYLGAIPCWGIFSAF